MHDGSNLEASHKVGSQMARVDLYPRELSPEQMVASEVIDKWFPDVHPTEESIRLVERFRAVKYSLGGDTLVTRIDPSTGSMFILRRDGEDYELNMYDMKTGLYERIPILATGMHVADEALVVDIDTPCAVNKHGVGNCTIHVPVEPHSAVEVTSPKYYGRGVSAQPEQRRVGLYNVEFPDFYDELVATMEQRGIPAAVLHQTEPVTLGQLAHELYERAA